ncbi:ZIP family metal transporter [Methanoplanus sp. FWC-SCC4]|uniref:ZIP family metal transporter n=1 Tax=Methanochimaera problematica TaxID=2609417 RepID=A0AA97I352_9EURY|nr:ZIP family metal transporter [Methanoplanus sp. FWC-SCC4]WOF15521.1 ZIP family metal transporter [Methanoplanus sp. FWC-SCC4]
MFEYFQGLGPVQQALLAGLFTWGMTAAGAAVVFLFTGFNRKFMDIMLGFAAGIMLAASIWSLIIPAIKLSGDWGYLNWFPASAGFLLGAVFIAGLDRTLPHLHIGSPYENAEGIKTSWRRSTLLVLAITLHNIPEGLAIGVSFGAAASGHPEATIAAAISLALGIGIQNLPEGIAISMPLHSEGTSAAKSFWYGQLSAVVEPVAAVLGAAAVVFVMPVLPYALSFAAGAMIYVVIEEVIPESQLNGNTDLATFGAISGFLVMMILDVALG